MKEFFFDVTVSVTVRAESEDEAKRKLIAALSRELCDPIKCGDDVWITECYETEYDDPSMLDAECDDEN